MTDELKFPTELKLWKHKIERIARRRGLDFYPIMHVIVTGEEMSEVVARHGMPTTPHMWITGQTSLLLKQRFRYGLGRIYEIVVNTIPSYAYLLQFNEVITQKSVMAHVVGHVHLFKNNFYFGPTNRNMINSMAADYLMVEEYYRSIGRERVKEFIDWVLTFEGFIDHNALYRKKPVPETEEEKTHRREKKKVVKRIEPREELPSYMNGFINPQEWLEAEKKRLEEELQEEIDIERGLVSLAEPARDILKFFMDYAPLELWQRNLVAMVRRWSYYNRPMRTKFIHEGFATLFEEEIMNEAGLIRPGELTQFAHELAGVQRKGRGLNPYRFFYDLWKDIRFRWDTGRHGGIWENCDVSSIRDNWDEFAVFKTLLEKYDFASEEFNLAWLEFCVFYEGLKKGFLGFPKELFIRNLSTRELLIPAWLRYRDVDREHEKFTKMQLEMEPLELQATLLAQQLLTEPSNVMSDEEAKLKARRDIYASEERLDDLWLWTPEEVRRELKAVEALRTFKSRWQRGELKDFCQPMSIDEEWLNWARKYPDRIQLGVGHEKILEVSSTCDDLMLIDEFFTKDFCEENRYFLRKAKTAWDWETFEESKHYFIESRAFRRIKKRLLFQFTNAYQPIIEVVDTNYNNRGDVYLVHRHNGVDLDSWSKGGMHMKDVLQRFFRIYGSKTRIHLETILTEQEEEKPWWFYWHQTQEKTTDDDQELNGIKVLFSYGLASHFEDEDETFFDKEEIGDELYTIRELGDVTFKSPF